MKVFTSSDSLLHWASYFCGGRHWVSTTLFFLRWDVYEVWGLAVFRCLGQVFMWCCWFFHVMVRGWWCQLGDNCGSFLAPSWHPKTLLDQLESFFRDSAGERGSAREWVVFCANLVGNFLGRCPVFAAPGRRYAPFNRFRVGSCPQSSRLLPGSPLPRMMRSSVGALHGRGLCSVGGSPPPDSGRPGSPDLSLWGQRWSAIRSPSVVRQGGVAIGPFTRESLMQIIGFALAGKMALAKWSARALPGSELQSLRMVVAGVSAELSRASDQEQCSLVDRASGKHARDEVEKFLSFLEGLSYSGLQYEE